MISKQSIETAYCFCHQKQRVYQYSTMEWQREDIEYAISSFAEAMDQELYRLIAEGQPDFLHSHSTFGQDLKKAVERLEQML